MAEWDPFADEGDTGTVVQRGAVSYSADETCELEGSASRLLVKDRDRCLMHCWGKLMDKEPWQKMPDPRPDLTWHKPSCTLEAWSHTDVRCELGAGAVRFTLARPEQGNHLSKGVMEALADAVFLLHERRDLRVAIFSGEGTLFCSGNNAREEGSNGLQAGEEAEAVERLGQRALRAGAFPDGHVDVGHLLQTRLWHALAMVPQFTICMANGSAMGHGLALVLCCDYALALEGAFFSLSDVKFGLVPAALAPYLLAKVGTGVSKRLFCTAESVSAAKAVELGILDDALPSLEDAQRVVHGLCERLTACGPRSVEAAKELVLGVAGQQIVEPLMFYTSMMAQQALGSDEARAATSAVRAAKPKPWEEHSVVAPA